MPTVSLPSDLGKISDPATFMRFASQIIKSIVDTMNGKLDFTSNLATQVIEVTFKVANTDQTVGHDLNRTGLNFFVVNKTASCDVFHGSNNDTQTDIILQCTSANQTVTLVLF